MGKINCKQCTLDQTAHYEQFDLDIHCSPIHFCQENVEDDNSFIVCMQFVLKMGYLDIVLSYRWVIKLIYHMHSAGLVDLF